MDKERLHRVVSGIILLIVGVLICFVALKIIPVDPKTIHAPYWLILLVGILTLFTGLAVLAKATSFLSILFVGVAMTLFSIVFTWAVLFGKNWVMRSNLFFLPDVVNTVIGRILLFFMIFVCWFITWMIWKSLWKRSEGKEIEREDDKDKDS